MDRVAGAAVGEDIRCGSGIAKMAMGSGVLAEMTSAARRVAAGACALLLAAALGGCSLFTPSRAEVEPDTVRAKVSAPSIIEDGVLTVGMVTSDAPQAMSGSDSRLIGYNVDVACALAHKLGLDVKVVNASDPASALKDGEADIFVGASVDDAPDGIELAGTVFSDASALFAKGGADGLSADSLAGATVGVQDASAAQDALASANIGATTETFPNVNKCFEALASGKVQYVACDATAGAYLARAYDDISFAGAIGTASSFGVAVPDGSGELATAVTAALDAMGSDGTLEAIHRTWYGDLPADLSGALLSGVTIQEERSDDDGADADADAPAASDDADDSVPVSDGLNSLSS